MKKEHTFFTITNRKINRNHNGMYRNHSAWQHTHGDIPNAHNLMRQSMTRTHVCNEGEVAGLPLRTAVSTGSKLTQVRWYIRRLRTLADASRQHN